jgi:succinyl-diaminopimelate desuccinylase
MPQNFDMNLVELLQTLLRFETVTPKDDGCLDFIEYFLNNLGAECYRIPCNEVDNLYAKIGKGPQVFCFAGHTDVVPAGDVGHWSVPPFAGHCHSGAVYGRGASDMKGAIAAFLYALSNLIKNHGLSDNWSVSIMLTSDEEGPAIDGTRHILNWLKEKNETIDLCLVGEPTNPNFIGEMVKVGRRGSLNARVSVEGLGGHVAYPQEAKNPIPPLLSLLTAITQNPLDEGAQDFPPSSLQITSIDVGNETTNVIPKKAQARMNIRFNPTHTGASLTQWLQNHVDHVESVFGTDYRLTLESTITAEPFITQNSFLQKLVCDVIEEVTGIPPQLSTTGGTSDARFIQTLCPVVEFGLVNKTAHQPDEHVLVEHLEVLSDVYTCILKKLV